MAISIDWVNRIINVPQSDLVQTGANEFVLDLDQFRLELKSLEASEEGVAFLDTHQHNPPVAFGGTTQARAIEIINGYTVTFEDGVYAVTLTNANSNVLDVTNLNSVSVRSQNSAGLVQVSSGTADITQAQTLEILLKLSQVWQDHGFDITNPAVIGDDLIEVAGTTRTITYNEADNNTTIQRQ